MANSNPPHAPPPRPGAPPPPAKPAAPPPPAAKAPAVEEDQFPPQKFKRPLAQPGDRDYVSGQPTTDEEADKIEKEEAEKHAAALKAAKDRAAAAAAAAAAKK